MPSAHRLPDGPTMAGLLNRLAPACRDGRYRVHDCRLDAVVAGRRGKLFGLVDAETVDTATGRPTTRRIVVQRFPEGPDSLEEGRKVFRRLRQRARHSARVRPLREWAAFAPQLQLLLIPFPFDYRLPALADACDPARVAARIDGLLGTATTVSAIAPVRYVPEKRCQIRYTLETFDGPRQVYGKVTSDARAASLVPVMAAVHRALAGSGLATTPPPLGHIAEWNLVLQQAVDGRTLYALHDDGASPAAAIYRDTGAALRAFQGVRVDGLTRYTASDETVLLAAMLHRGVLPEPERQAAADLFSDVVNESPAFEAAAFATSHRDFYDKQILIGDAQPSIIDLDTIALAPPMLDVGNFIAHLWLRRLQGRLTAGAAREAADAFLGGYIGAGAADDRALSWWTACALLRLTTVYAVRPTWSHVTGALVAGARAALSGRPMPAADRSLGA